MTPTGNIYRNRQGFLFFHVRDLDGCHVLLRASDCERGTLIDTILIPMDGLPTAGYTLATGDGDAEALKDTMRHATGSGVSDCVKRVLKGKLKKGGGGYSTALAPSEIAKLVQDAVTKALRKHFKEVRRGATA